MSDKILQTIKSLLGGSDDPEDTTFDTDILIQINFAINRLHQLGLETATNFHCDSNTKWEALVEDETNLDMIKTYIYAKVKKVFDPPQNGTHMQALNDTINETEWCICHELIMKEEK